RIILYADTVTDSISKALDESERRRNKQLAYNKLHGVTPRSAERRIDNMLSPYDHSPAVESFEIAEPMFVYGGGGKKPSGKKMSSKKAEKSRLEIIEAEMIEAAKNLDFERAAHLRDMIAQLKTGSAK
ncbi:MAG: UvrB/UvrC motif-containing protein, partial [Chitinispirillales bacterium]|nr:UvrB/UvrC motif-containing protein [Chitinispirillales bacterium]